MNQIDILPSEASYLELATKLKKEKLAAAAALVQEGEAILERALVSILDRAGVDAGDVTDLRLFRDVDGTPAKLVWPEKKESVDGNTDREAAGETSQA